METALLLVTLFATPPSDPGKWIPPAAHPPRAHRAPRAQRPPTLPWPAIFRRCGAPCKLWARHILEAATSPRGFRWQLQRLARVARQAWTQGRLTAPQARRLKQGLTRLHRGLARANADGRLSRQERLALLKGVLKVAAFLHRAQQRIGHRRPPAPRAPVVRPPRLPARTPAPPGSRRPQPPPITIEIIVPPAPPR